MQNKYDKQTNKLKTTNSVLENVQETKKMLLNQLTALNKDHKALKVLHTKTENELSELRKEVEKRKVTVAKFQLKKEEFNQKRHPRTLIRNIEPKFLIWF